MSWMTPQLLTAVAPLFNIGGKLLAQSGKVDAGKSLAIMGNILGMTNSIAGAFGPTAKTGTKLSEAAGKASTNFSEALKIGDLDIGTGAFLRSPGGMAGNLLGIKPLTDPGLNFKYPTNLENLTGTGIFNTGKPFVENWNAQ